MSFFLSSIATFLAMNPESSKSWSIWLSLPLFGTLAFSDISSRDRPYRFLLKASTILMYLASPLKSVLYKRENSSKSKPCSLKNMRSMFSFKL